MICTGGQLRPPVFGLHACRRRGGQDGRKDCDTPGGGGGDHEQLLAALADADAETAAALRKAEQQALQIRSFINRIPNSTSRAILRTRYLTMLSWAEVRRTLARSGMNYSKDHLYKLHKKALVEAEEKWINMQTSSEE